MVNHPKAMIRNALVPGEVHLWLLNQDRDADLQTAWSTLSDEERGRAEKYKLDPKSYSFRKGYYKPNFKSRFLKDVDFHYMCDEQELKCKGCNNCVRLLDWNKKQTSH